jgi:TonB family protein
MGRIFFFCFCVALNGLGVAGAWAQTEAMGRFDSVEIISDTQGTDFGLYLADVLRTVRENWRRLIPESAESKKGKVAIEFAIKKDGQLAGMKLVGESGNVMLDRAAWAGITGSAPLPPLPTEFKGKSFAPASLFLQSR